MSEFKFKVNIYQDNSELPTYVQFFETRKEAEEFVGKGEFTGIWEIEKIEPKKHDIHTIVGRAREFAKRKHLGQNDDSGEPFYHHPMQVANILRNVADLDQNLIAAAYLHDVIEDCGVTYEELVEKFGRDVADLVNEVTHEGSRETGYYFPRLKTQRGIMLKFADRLSNISRMEPWDPERRDHYLRRSRFWKEKSNE